MSISGIQGQLLEVTVVECNRLKDTEWFSRQDPYVCLQYGTTKFRTRTCTDGGKNPKFQEKFLFTLIEGLREISVVVWNSNTVTHDDLIGSGKIQLQEVLSRNYDDKAWPLHTKTGRFAGEVKVIMHYEKANKPASSYPSAPPYSATSQPHVPPYSVPPLTSTPSYTNPAYSSPATAYPSYPTSSLSYPPPPDPSIHTPSMHQYPASYAAPPYPPHSAYSAPPYPPGPPPSAYPASTYPPPPGPPPHGHYGPPGHYGMYPPPPPY